MRRRKPLVTEDEDPNTLLRSSNIARRVVTGMSEQLQWYGYRVVDEEALAAHYALMIPRRTSAGAVMRRLKESALSTVPLLAMVESRALIQYPSQEFTVRVRITLSAQIYDLPGGRFVDSFKETVQTVTSPKCAADEMCIEEHVGVHARKVAIPLSSALARKLERYSPSVVARPPAGRSPQGMPVAHTVRFEYFEQTEVVAILGVMTEEFPGARNAEKVVDRGYLKVYSYQTTASGAKLKEWFAILLHDMGFDVDDDILIRFDGVNVTISKVGPTPERRQSVD